MTLLVTVFAAVISTVYWYVDRKRDLNVELLCFMYWGASLMWLVDAVFEYAELHEQYFTPAAADMLNDFYLGLSAVALGLVIWLVTVLIKDPRGVLKRGIVNRKN